MDCDQFVFLYAGCRRGIVAIFLWMFVIYQVVFRNVQFDMEDLIRWARHHSWEATQIQPSSLAPLGWNSQYRDCFIAWQPCVMVGSLAMWMVQLCWGIAPIVQGFLDIAKGNGSWGLLGTWVWGVFFGQILGSPFGNYLV